MMEPLLLLLATNGGLVHVGLRSFRIDHTNTNHDGGLARLAIVFSILEKWRVLTLPNQNSFRSEKGRSCQRVQEQDTAHSSAGQKPHSIGSEKGSRTMIRVDTDRQILLDNPRERLGALPTISSSSMNSKCY
eukprot:scaffold168_cov124-Cylindrotheca_fusiformis.AAC.22